MRSKLAFAASLAALLSVALVAGCGDDDAPAVDAAPPDAPEAPDANAPPDAGPPDAGAPVDYPKQTVTLSTGIDMQYVEVGDPAGAETVIFLHGYTDSSRSFFPTIEALNGLNADLHIYGLDLRGHGGSSMPAEGACPANPKSCFELSDFAEDVTAFMVDKGIATAHLVGHSLGTLVAHELAVTSPASFESLVLIDATASTVDNPVLKDFILEGTIEGDVEGRWQFALEADPAFGQWPTDAYDLTPLDADPNAEEWMRTNWVADPTADPDFLEKIIPETASVKLGTWLGTVQTLIESNNTARLGTLAVNSLIIWATQDGLFPDADQVALRAALDVAAEACLSGYHWKQYGKVPLPASGLQDADLGRNTQWGAPAQVAADINAFVTTGEPTPDLYFANPIDLTDIQTEAGTAEIIVKPAATGCAL